MVALTIMIGIWAVGQAYPDYRVIESIEVKLDVALRVLPVSATFICMVCFNNWFLLNVGVGYYAIAKSLSVPCSVVLTYLILGVTTSVKSILACLLITAGVFVASSDSLWGSGGDLSVMAMVLAVMASIFTAGYQIAVKSGLAALKGDQWMLGFYNSLWCVLVLTPIGVIMGEGAVASQVRSEERATLHSFAHRAVCCSFVWPQALSPATGINWLLVGALLFSGVVGFSIAQATYMSIHHTSALAHHVTGAFKSVVQAALGYYFFQEAQTLTKVVGLFITLGGSYAFMMSRMTPTPTQPAPPVAVGKPTKPEQIV